MDPPPWKDAKFRPLGDRVEVLKALKSAITPDQATDGLKIRHEVDRFEPGSYRPEVTINKSSGDSILPELSDGSSLSRFGAMEAIDRTAQAFNLEASLHQSASTPDAISLGLAEVAMKAQELAKLLTSLSQEARWRLATLPSVDLWPKSVGDSKLRYPNPFRMEPKQAEGLFRNISVEDSQFLHLRIGELIPSLSGSNPEESKWNHDLLELAKVFQKAVIAPPGPGERRGVRRRSNEFGAIGGFPLLLLIRECDSILCASDKVQLGSDLKKGIWAGRNSHRYHRGLKPFADAIFKYATGLDAMSSLNRPFKEYSNSMNSGLDPHPFAWRSFRIAALRWTDYLMQLRTKPESKDVCCTAIRKNLKADYLRFKSLANFQPHTKADYQRSQDNLRILINDLQHSHASAEVGPERDSLLEWVTLLEKDLQQVEDLLNSGENSETQGKDLFFQFGPFHRSFPRGRTFLSGMV